MLLNLSSFPFPFPLSLSLPPFFPSFLPPAKPEGVSAGVDVGPGITKEWKPPALGKLCLSRRPQEKAGVV